MSGINYYDVTEWKTGNPYEDIGEVINSILADVKARQTQTDADGFGKPGAVIYIPSGDYRLRTQVLIDISYLRIEGSGHGFVSSSIRFNTPETEWKNLHELWPGGSRVMVELEVPDNAPEEEGAAFLVKREGEPRISSVEFVNFCIDGLHFEDRSTGTKDPENTYLNGKTGIYVASKQDSFRVAGMGLIYLEHGLTVCLGDAISVHDNFIAECGNCIELRGPGQAGKVTDNLIGAGYRGYSIYISEMAGMLITANNVFPRGSSSIHFSGVVRSCVTSNRFHSFYPGMLRLENHCTENLVASNHFLRDAEPWPPMKRYDNGLEDDFGLLCVNGDNNTISANHISETIDRSLLKPLGVKPVVIRVTAGTGNYIYGNHIVATTTEADHLKEETENCFEAQVGALLTTNHLTKLETVEVVIDSPAQGNTVLDTVHEGQFEADSRMNVIRVLP
ncbi:MAG: right-handed parallel beta-helix repeat-containing protein [Blautia sp.]|nr:right-handed parallel beta-helix repeat-containing protein [Blautia sp.]